MWEERGQCRGEVRKETLEYGKGVGEERSHASVEKEGIKGEVRRPLKGKKMGKEMGKREVKV